jgi:hypothetical protein
LVKLLWVIEMINKLKQRNFISVAIIASTIVLTINSSNLNANEPNVGAEVIKYKGWSIPQYVKPDPNLATLRHYHLQDYELLNDKQLGHYRVESAGNHQDFDQKTETSNYLSQQMNQSGLLSYIMYDGDRIKYDEISPKTRLGDIYTNETQYLSNSVGKSFVSYLVGHAICEGYISGIDTVVDDWPLIEGTLYHGQTLIDLLNMNAGDAKYVDDADGMVGSGRWYNTHNIKTFAETELANSKPIPKKSRQHHYNGLATNIVLNYAIHKMDYKIQPFLNSVFQDKVKIQHPATMRYNIFARDNDGRMTSTKVPIEHGTAIYTFYLSRYDYLRVALAMLNDWQADNCVGKYLKNLVKRKIPQKRFMEKEKGYRFSAKSYAGQFHMDYLGLEGRKILSMDGYGGQHLMIDFDESRIIAISTVHTNYDYRSLVLDAMKTGIIKERKGNWN